MEFALNYADPHGSGELEDQPEEVVADLRKRALVRLEAELSAYPHRLDELSLR